MLPLLGALGGAALAPTLGVSALTAGAIGSGLGGFMQSGNLGQGIMTGLGSYATGGMYGKLAGAGPLADKTIMGMAAPEFAKIAGAGLGGMASMPMKMQQIGPQRSGTQATPYSRTGAGFQRPKPTRSVKGYQMGGIASIKAPQELNDQELILAAVDALKGKVGREQGTRILAEVSARFGQEALMDIADKAQKGAIAQTERPSEGRIKGPGDAMDDLVPATLEGEEPILLSNNEYIVAGDVVSHLGNGDSEKGGAMLDQMSDNVRKARTGTTQQAPQINAREFMPA